MQTSHIQFCLHIMLATPNSCRVYLEARAVCVSPDDGEPVARLEFASHSKSNNCGEVVDHKILHKKSITNKVHLVNQMVSREITDCTIQAFHDLNYSTV